MDNPIVSHSDRNELTKIDAWYPFNDYEKKLMRRSWKSLKIETEQVACDIYKMIFNQCPDARKLFPFMRLPAKECERKSKEFVFQALRFIQVLESGLCNIDNLDAFDPILDNIGRRHGKLDSNTEFQPYYWSVFLECTIHHIRLCLARSKVDHWNDCDLDTVIILWRHLVKGICMRIKNGYLIDIANRNNSMCIRRSSLAAENKDLSVSRGSPIRRPRAPTNVPESVSAECFSCSNWPFCGKADDDEHSSLE